MDPVDGFPHGDNLHSVRCSQHDILSDVFVPGEGFDPGRVEAPVGPNIQGKVFTAIIERFLLDLCSRHQDIGVLRRLGTRHARSLDVEGWLLFRINGNTTHQPNLFFKLVSSLSGEPLYN